MDPLQSYQTTISATANAAETTQGLSCPDKIFRISISPLDYGYHVEVGCKEFAISETAQLISLLTQYLIDPARIHKAYEDGTLFKTENS